MISDLFSPEYAAAIAMPAGLSGDCQGNALCETWMARFAADRPHLTGTAAQVPILVVYGMADQVIGSGQMACVFERLSQDGASVEACVEPAGDHVNILGTRAEHVAQWIGSRTLGEAAPAACDMDMGTFVDSGGIMMIPCQTPPPND